MAVPVRAASGVARRPATRLQVVPGRSRVAWFMVVLTVLVGAVMIGAVLLHTRLAERQLRIDELQRSFVAEQEQFDILRAQRAELRSPTRLAAEAAALGMVPGAETEYFDVDPMVLAITIARTGENPLAAGTEPGADARMRPLDQFRLVKSVTEEAP
jgi:hypothetical protein